MTSHGITRQGTETVELVTSLCSLVDRCRKQSMAKGPGRKGGGGQGADPAHRLLADNRLARHQYEILETLETGIELLGTEVKSIRAGQVNLRDGFCLIRQGELQLHNVHISPHSHAGRFFNHDPLRVRKLLAHRREIDRLRVALDQKGLTLIPLNLHLKGSWIKVTIGLARGRKLHDKRQEEKRKQVAKETRAALSRL
jgi:SsrA-binding protein